MKQTYEQAITQVFKDEGGYTNEAADPGGPTNWGITIHDAQTFWKSGATAEDVRAMPKSVAEDIYYNHYAHLIRYADLPPGVDYAIFDYGINSGISHSVKTTQRIVGEVQDGSIGLHTLSAISSHDPIEFINTLYDERLKYLETLHNWPTYKNGWTRRCLEGRQLALKLNDQYKGTYMPISQNLTDTHPIHPAGQGTSVSLPQLNLPPVNFNDVEDAMKAAASYLPTALSIVSVFYPAAGAFAKFLPLLQVAIQATDVVAKATGQSPDKAAQTVADHLTPGQPNSPALS